VTNIKISLIWSSQHVFNVTGVNIIALIKKCRVHNGLVTGVCWMG